MYFENTEYSGKLDERKKEKFAFELSRFDGIDSWRGGREGSGW